MNRYSNPSALLASIPLDVGEFELSRPELTQASDALERAFAIGACHQLAELFACAPADCQARLWSTTSNLVNRHLLVSLTLSVPDGSRFHLHTLFAQPGSPDPSIRLLADAIKLDNADGRAELAALYPADARAWDARIERLASIMATLSAYAPRFFAQLSATHRELLLHARDGISIARQLELPELAVFMETRLIALAAQPGAQASPSARL